MENQKRFGSVELNLVMKLLKFLFTILTFVFFVYGIVIYKSQKNIAKDYPKAFVVEFCNQDQENELKRMFSIKYSHYLNLTESFGTIQKGIIAISVIALLMLIFGAKNLPFFGFLIPDKLLYLIVYFGGLYLLANFGLTINAIIENRLSLHAYTDCIESLNGTSGYKNSLRHVLSDSTFGDNWFSHFFGIFDQGVSGSGRTMSKVLGWFGLYGIYAILLGLYHGFILTATVEFIKRNNIDKVTSFFMLFFMLVMFLSMAASFVLKMKYPIFWIASIYLVLTLWLFFWHSKGQKIHEKNKIKTEKK